MHPTVFFSSVFLDKVKDAFQQDPNISCLLMDSYFRDVLASSQTAWRRVVALAIYEGVPVPAFSSALSYYDSFRCERLPANLLQVFLLIHSYETPFESFIIVLRLNEISTALIPLS